MGNVVFTNGCFDLFHLGHLRTLEYCSILAGINGRVIVGVNSDYSIANIKGPDRPIICEGHRCEILEAIEFVDSVYMFHQLTPYELIKRLKPDIIVKGPDYVGLEDQVVGSNFAKVKIVPEDFCPDTSTSQIIDKVRKL